MTKQNTVAADDALLRKHEQLCKAHCQGPASIRTEIKPAFVHVSTSQYERSHGRMPRGEGNWAFFFDRAMNIDTAFWYNGTYSEAKKAAKIEAAKRGVYCVVLGS